MFLPLSPASSFQRGWIRLGALLALVSQVAVASAPLGEGREGIGMSAHVEAPGQRNHYAHNEATCVACVAQAMHAAGIRRPTVFLRVEHQPRVAIAAAPLVPALELTPNLFSRAPPVIGV